MWICTQECVDAFTAQIKHEIWVCLCEMFWNHFLLTYWSRVSFSYRFDMTDYNLPRTIFLPSGKKRFSQRSTNLWDFKWCYALFSRATIIFMGQFMQLVGWNYSNQMHRCRCIQLLIHTVIASPTAMSILRLELNE